MSSSRIETCGGVAEDVGAQVMPGHLPVRGLFDRQTPLGWDLPSSAPVADYVLAQAKGHGQLDHAPQDFDCSVECVHARIITYRDSIVNTQRVRQVSQPVNNVGMAFHDNLRRLRLARKLTQEQLALECGWRGQSRIANYEKPTREPNLSELKLLAQALRVSQGELLGEQPASAASQPAIPDRAMLDETLILLDYDIDQGGKYSERDYARRLIELYGRVVADGGRLTLAHNNDFMSEVDSRRGDHGGSQKRKGKRRQR